MSVSHFRITQASVISAFTFIVGQIIAFVPSLGTDKQNLISAGSTAIALGFLLANAIHTLASSKNPTQLVEAHLPELEKVGGAILKQASEDVNKGASATKIIEQAAADEQIVKPESAIKPDPPAEAAPAPAPVAPAGTPVAPPAA